MKNYIPAEKKVWKPVATQGNGTFVCLRPLIFYWVKKTIERFERNTKKNKKEYDIESDWKVFAFAANMCEYT